MPRFTKAIAKPVVITLRVVILRPPKDLAKPDVITVDTDPSPKRLRMTKGTMI